MPYILPIITAAPAPSAPSGWIQRESHLTRPTLMRWPHSPPFLVFMLQAAVVALPDSFLRRNNKLSPAIARSALDVASMAAFYESATSFRKAAPLDGTKHCCPAISSPAAPAIVCCSGPRTHILLLSLRSLLVQVRVRLHTVARMQPMRERGSLVPEFPRIWCLLGS